MTWPRQNEDLLPKDDEANGTTDDKIDSLFNNVLYKRVGHICELVIYASWSLHTRTHAYPHTLAKMPPTNTTLTKRNSMLTILNITCRSKLRFFCDPFWEVFSLWQDATFVVGSVANSIRPYAWRYEHKRDRSRDMGGDRYQARTHRRQHAYLSTRLISIRISPVMVLVLEADPAYHASAGTAWSANSMSWSTIC